MKRYWLYFGTVGTAAALGLGLYTYINQRQLYQESETKTSETEGFLEEEQQYEPEYDASLPEDEMKEAPVSSEPLTAQKEQKKIPKTRPVLKQDQKQKSVQIQTPKNLLPKARRLDDIVESDNIVEDKGEENQAEKRPSYDLFSEERDQLSDQQLLKYGQEALSNLDYKLAEMYSSDFKKRYGAKQSLFGECSISQVYDKDLSDMIKNCKTYNYDSVFRKVMWMNLFFIPQYEQSINECQDDECKIDPYGDMCPFYLFNTVALTKKGNKALEVIKDCHEQSQ